MRPYKFIPKRRLFELPECEECGARMWLLDIEPAGPDQDRRTFECTDCRNLKVNLVSYGPAVSAAE
jgi:hypothetical protein